MASSHLSEADDSRQSEVSHLTIGWFAKRSMLWLLTVAGGIGAACCLYAYADDTNVASARADHNAAVHVHTPVTTTSSITPKQ